MTIDWANPTVQGAVVAALISFAGVLIAGIAGVSGAVLGGRIAARAARDAAAAAANESAANREESRQADERRHRWEVESQVRARGEAAAEAILDTLNELDLGPFSFWQALSRRKAATDPVEPNPDQAELEPSYTRIQRLLIAIDNPAAREAMDALADVLYQHHQVSQLLGDSAMAIWANVHRDAKRVLGAYLRREPIPEATGIKRFLGALEDYYEQVYPEEFAERKAQDAADAAEHQP
jgi:hypothetical protein